MFCLEEPILQHRMDLNSCQTSNMLPSSLLSKTMKLLVPDSFFSRPGSLPRWLPCRDRSSSLHAIRDSASPRPKTYWTRTFEGLVPSLGTGLVTPSSFYLFSGKLEYLNKIMRFNTSIVRMKMNPCEEIRRRQMPQIFPEDMKWSSA